MMKLRYLVVAAVMATIPFTNGFAQSKEFKAGKSLEVQSRILRVLDAC